MGLSEVFYFLACLYFYWLEIYFRFFAFARRIFDLLLGDMERVPDEVDASRIEGCGGYGILGWGIK